MLFRNSKKKALRRRADPLARAVLDRAIAPWPYKHGWVADTLEARIDWASLHGALLANRLARDADGLSELAEPFSEALFWLYDYSLRETGVGDSSIARKIRKFGEQYAGLGVALRDSLTASEPHVAVADALRRNGVGQDRQDAVARYAIRLADHLDTLPAAIVEAADQRLWPEFHVD